MLSWFTVSAMLWTGQNQEAPTEEEFLTRLIWILGGDEFCEVAVDVAAGLRLLPYLNVQGGWSGE